MKEDLKRAQGAFEGNVFYYPVRIYYEDTDAEGIVYFANYLKFAERCRTEFIRALGHEQRGALEQHKCGFAVRHLEVDYKRPLYLDDEIIVTCEIKELKKLSMLLHQEIIKNGVCINQLEIKVAHIDLTSKTLCPIADG